MARNNSSDCLFKDSPFKIVGDDLVSVEMPVADIKIVTSGGLRIPAHSKILAAASPVLESIIDRPAKHRRAEKTISILGVPCESVAVFVRFLYSSKCTEAEIEKYGIHLLALSHVYLVPQLKQKCTRGLAKQLTTENVVDVLQLAKLCDAPDLVLKCNILVHKSYKSVEKTEGWKIMQDHNPFLELDILQFIDETESRRKKSRRQRKAQSVYLELSEAMECLEHICKEGCTTVGPHDMEPAKNRGPCNNFSTCQGLQLLFKHFASCKKRVNGVCVRCKGMWKLLKLHSSICDQPDLCKVPLCRHFKVKMEQEKKGTEEDARWKLLVRRVMSAKAISSLSMPKRKREEEAILTQIFRGEKALTCT